MVKLSKAIPRGAPLVRPPACHTLHYGGTLDLFAALWSAPGISHQGLTDDLKCTFLISRCL